MTDKERLDFLENTISADGILLINSEVNEDTQCDERVELFTLDSQWVYDSTLRNAIDKAINMSKL